MDHDPGKDKKTAESNLQSKSQKTVGGLGRFVPKLLMGSDCQPTTATSCIVVTDVLE